MPAHEVEAIARSGITLTDFDSGARILWEPTPIQCAIWQAREQHHRLFVTKPRRAYASTALDFDDVLFTVCNDGSGERVRTGVAIDTEDHVAERIYQMSSFLTQLHVPHTAVEGLITLTQSESQITCFTASGKRAAASTGLQRVRYSEAAYYKPGEIGTISAAAGKQAQEIIETTIGTHATNFTEVRARWREVGAWRPYFQLFFPFESHAEYRAPAHLITEAEWEWAQEPAQGFTIREAASYWLREILPKFGGDKQRARGEYPQRAEHMFDTALGRWVSRTPRIVPPIDVVKVMGNAGEVWPLLIWRKPERTSGRISIALDAAKGAGVSRATVCVVDETDGFLCAAFADAFVLGDDQAIVAQKAWAMYSTQRDDGKWTRPRLRAEDNVTGQIVIQPLRRLGMPVETFDTTEASQILGMQAAKRGVETGILEGPAELAEECDECFKDPVTGKFKGHKDLLMTYGMCLRGVSFAQLGPKAPDVEANSETRINVRKAIMRQQKLQRGRWL